MPLRASSHPGSPNSPSCSALAWYSCWPGLSPWGESWKRTRVARTAALTRYRYATQPLSWMPLPCVLPCLVPQVARFMGPAWGPSGADRTQVGPMLAPWSLLSGASCLVVQPFGKQFIYHNLSVRSARFAELRTIIVNTALLFLQINIWIIYICMYDECLLFFSYSYSTSHVIFISTP